MKPIHIKTDGTRTEVMPKGKKFTLKELQKFVGGLIELVSLDDDMTLVVNEEGKINDLPVNFEATHEWEKVYGSQTDVIVGDVLLTPSKFIS